MTVAEVDALLYVPGQPREQLLRALRIPALSAVRQASFPAPSKKNGAAATPARTVEPPADVEPRGDGSAVISRSRPREDVALDP